MAITPKSAGRRARALLRSVYDQPGNDAARAQFSRILD
jgi:hypothetical protein